MEDIYSLFAAIERPGEKVMATIVDVEGTAYKKEGSSMVFIEDGTQIGMLSAGCLEEDLAIRAAYVLKKGEVTTVQYDLREETDLTWGQGAGCNGIITILLETIDERLKKDLDQLKKCLDLNIPVLGLKKIGELGEYLFLPQEGEPFGWWEGEIPDRFYETESGMMQDQPIFQHLYRPKPRLIVFGAGPDMQPMVSLAAKIGFSVIVCDWRQHFCRKEFFPEADILLVGFPANLLGQIDLRPTDYVVIASHHFQRDKEILAGLSPRKVRYIGVLGPKERTKRLFSKKEIPDWLHSPIGLTIGAKGPEEIAVSILAELIKVYRIPPRRDSTMHGLAKK